MCAPSIFAVLELGMRTDEATVFFLTIKQLFCVCGMTCLLAKYKVT